MEEAGEKLTEKLCGAGLDYMADVMGGGLYPRGIKPKEFIFKHTKLERSRINAPPHIVKKALAEVKKIQSIPYKTKTDYGGLFWGDNPVKDEPAIAIDLPVINVETLRERNVKDKTIFHTPTSLKSYRKISESSIITHGDEIIMIYVNAKTDKAVLKAVERLPDLGKQMMLYHPEKAHTFYSRFSLNKNPAKRKKFETDNVDRYYGWNALDGMIRHLNTTTYGGNVVDFQPRAEEAMYDEHFLYNLIYSYCANYELEKRYAPAIAKYRLMKAKGADRICSIPGVPLDSLPATSLGASANFASALHDDSGILGITETIIWTLPDKGKKQYFVNDMARMYFDLSEHNSIILIPPKISHGTANTGKHGGFGFVNITKANLVSDTPLMKEWYDGWRDWLKSAESRQRFKEAVKDNQRGDLTDENG